MFKRTLLLTQFLLFFLFHSYAYCVIYKLTPNQSMVLTNTLDTTISAYCLINAVANTPSTISIVMLRGTALFNRTTLNQGQTLFQNIYNTQYIPVVAESGASARITNIGTFTVQANCELE